MELGWTIAYRNKHANHFKRVTNWEGTWHQASRAAALFCALHPELQVWIVVSVHGECWEADMMATGKMIDYGQSEDWGNVLTDNGKRVKIRETGTLPEEIINYIPDSVKAEADWRKGAY